VNLLNDRNPDHGPVVRFRFFPFTGSVLFGSSLILCPSLLQSLIHQLRRYVGLSVNALPSTLSLIIPRSII